jgi:DNA invertase Pin-like site-specific DNA recombinase
MEAAPRRSKRRTREPGIVGYVRVSTDEQAASGLGLDAQRRSIKLEAERRQLPLIVIHQDAGISGKSLDRPALNAALDDLDNGTGTALMVAKLDRLTRSVHDATGLMMRAEKAGWGLVALDVAVDTTTPQGAAMAQVLAVFAELERRLIGQRTRDALAVKRAQGVKLGRPASLPADVIERIVRDHEAGCGWSEIARALNAEGVPTGQGGKQWYPTTVRNVALSQAAGRA